MLKSLPRPGFWMSVALAATGVGLQMALSLPFGMLDVVFERVLHQPPPQVISEPLVLGIVNILAFGATIAFGLLLNSTSPAEAFPLVGITARRLLGIAVLVSGLAVVLSELDNVFRWLVPVPHFIQEMFRRLLFDEDGLLSRIFLLVMVAPVTEELLFRGIIMRGLLSRYRPWSAIVLSSLLFGAVHLNPWQFVSATVLGMALGWFYFRTGSIALSVIAHAIANGLVLVATSIPVEIPGLTGPPDFEQVEFQPWWLDIASAVLLFAGTIIFWAASRTSETPEPKPPPIIPPPIST